MLQSLQVICTAGLLSVQAQSSPLSSRPLRVCLAWAIGLVFLFGLSTLVFGVMVRHIMLQNYCVLYTTKDTNDNMYAQVLHETGPGLIDGVFVFPPHVVTYASHAITTGVLVTVLAGFLAGALVAYEWVAPFASLWAIFTWCVAGGGW